MKANTKTKLNVALQRFYRKEIRKALKVINFNRYKIDTIKWELELLKSKKEECILK